MNLSVIIPVFNEEAHLKELIPAISGNAQLIVVDGGSTDRSVEQAEQCGALVLHAEKGRAKQCNKGAAHAAGEVLYFLHADVRPPKGFEQSIIQAVQDGAVAGCFRMKWNDSHVLLRFFGWLTQFFGSRYRGGDQSLFVRADVFHKMEGYRKMPLFEDVEIIERIRPEGEFRVLKDPVIASARRYRQTGVIRLHWYYFVLHSMYRFGFPIERIRMQYDRTVGKS